MPTEGRGAIYMKSGTVYLSKKRGNGGVGRKQAGKKNTEVFEATDKEVQRNREKGPQM